MTEREALKLAMEFVEANHFGGPDAFELLTAINEALAQPEQEPVAWRNAALRVGEDLCSVGPFGYYDMTAEQWLDWALSVVTVHTPPPQRTWVGLTDEEQQELYNAWMQKGDGWGSFYTLIEAKLKAKNA